MSAPANPRAPHRSQVKETLVSIIIAFALAFVFRAFVIEAFVIPTGSMAPTLMGAHMRFTGPRTGAVWPVGEVPTDPRMAAERPRRSIQVTDPMSGERLDKSGVSRRSGDRILVFKYLASIYDPSRWDVVVFKAPTHPQTNYIKRLVGLPGEQIAIADGDVFVRTPPPGDSGEPADLWAREGWRIARKPQRVQQAVWQSVYDSRYAPLGAGAFRSPWRPATPGWSGEREALSYAGGDRAVLAWDTQVRRILDRYPYNEVSASAHPGYSVSDLRIRCSLEPAGAGLVVTGVISTRGHDFRARLDGQRAVVSMRPSREGQGGDEGWVMLDEGPCPPLERGGVATIEFWHVDQALHLVVNGRLVAHGVYDWHPALRLVRAADATVEQAARAYDEQQQNLLIEPARYKQPVVYWEFSGTGGGATPSFSLPAVALDRDLYYQPAEYRNREPAAGTHPLSTLSLGTDHFFVCGDNSPQSEDGRLWGDPNPWVAATIDDAPSVIPRDLMIGKAFFVYFPSLLRETRSPVPVPDFGRMRFIW